MARKTDKLLKNGSNIASTAIRGGWITSSFFARNSATVIMFLFVVVFYIGFKYEFMTRMEYIKQLEKELNIVKTESIRQRSVYMSRVREMSMQQMVDSMHLGLKIQQQPPFKLSYENE